MPDSTTSRASIKVPVLLIKGIYDVIFHRHVWRTAYNHFTGTHDKTLIEIPDGQLVMLDRHAATFRADVSRWVTARGL